VKSPNGSLDALQRELDAVGGAFTKLTRDIDKLRRRVEQLAALRTAEPAEAAQLHALERVLEIDRVAQHVRAACAAAELTDAPVPHLVISDVFPGDVYAAIVEAIPGPAFFDAVTDNAYELRVPPRLAPFQTLVTWEFVTAVVLRAFSPALIARLHEPLAAFARTQFPALPALDDWNVEVTLSQGHIVKRCPGYAGASSEDRPWDLLTTIVDVGASHEEGLYGSVLGSSTVKNIPFRPNGALAFVGPASVHQYASIPRRAPKHAVRYAYQFGVGPTREGRRILNAMMNTE
jgi:hypothetical protein